jgi:aldehyde:ferredoxin oxidoreductase
VDLAIDLQARGVIDDRWKGAELLHEGYESTMMLMRMTVRGEGIGTVLARGIPGLIQEFGEQAAQRAVHVEGIDMVFDPRAEGLGPKELAQIVSPRRHWVSGYANPYRSGMDSSDLLTAGERAGLTEEQANRILPDPEHFHVGRLLPAIEDWYTVLSSVGICTRAVSKYFYPARVARLLSAITGDDWSETELMAAGRRGWDLLRALNGRVGIDQAQDKFPPRWLEEPLYGSDGQRYRIRELGPRGHELDADDTDAVLADYYKERGWDSASGLPTAQSAECEEREDW